MSNFAFSLTVLLTFFISLHAHAEAHNDGETQLVIDTDFEGGSARVLEVDQKAAAVRIMPGGDPDRGWPAWWCFRVQGLAKGRSLTVKVMASDSILPSGRPGAGRPLSHRWATPDQAVWSTDTKTWTQTGVGQAGGGMMAYQVTGVGKDIWIAWGPMATPKITREWLRDAAATFDYVDEFELAKTLEGRGVAGIQIASGNKPVSGRQVIWLQARQHAWESGSSWVAKGIIDWMTGDDPDAIWLREHALTFVVPIMDVDRTATGDGGKESTPHDHNRDWSGKPHYPEVAAAQKRIKSWALQNRMGVFVDLHNPAPSNRKSYFYVAPDEAISEAMKPRRTRFVDVIDKEWNAPIPFDRKTRSTGPDYHPLWKQMSSTWTALNGNPDTISVCLESAWNTPHSTPAGYGQIGASLTRGISRFLQADVAKAN